MSGDDILTKFPDASGNADKLVDLARVSEQSERYDDMCKFMKALVGQKTDLSVEERNLLSVAYKNVVGSRRASWRTLNVDDQTNAEIINKYKKVVETELDTICQEVLALLKEKLIPAVKGKGDESEVFYEKMAADYYRYLSEFQDGGDSPSEAGKQATQHYENAYNVAKESLAETHPTRLGLALNFSVCYYEILKQPDKACSLAKEAFDAAIQKLDSLTDESYKDSTLIMQLLRDNLTLWTSENENGDAQVEEVED